MNDKPKKPAVKKLSPKKAKAQPKSDDLSLSFSKAMDFGDLPDIDGDDDDELLYYGYQMLGVDPDTLDPKEKRGYLTWLAQEESSKKKSD
jgi:hypothetical protein